MKPCSHSFENGRCYHCGRTQFEVELIGRLNDVHRRLETIEGRTCAPDGWFTLFIMVLIMFLRGC